MDPGAAVCGGVFSCGDKCAQKTNTRRSPVSACLRMSATRRRRREVLIGERSTVMSVSVCVCVCLFICARSYHRNYTSDLHQFFVDVTYVRGWVLLRRRSDTLCTSGFVDDV